MSSTIPTTQKVILFEENGPIDVLKYTDFPVPEISSKEVLVKNRFAGVNFIEAYFRKGIYPSEKPYVLGREASGTIVKVGSDVKDWAVGDKVAYLSAKTFTQYTKYDPAVGKILKLDADAKDDQLKLYAASLTQGLTALTFITEAYNVQEGDYILVTAAAGGVGLLLDQLISQRKAHVIAVASTDAKLAKAKSNGAEYLLNSTKLSEEEILAEIKKITGGKGVAASFDSVGKDTAELSLAAVARKGSFVSFGNASGPVPPLSINRLSAKNLKVLRPQVFGYIQEPEEFKNYTGKLFGLIDSGKLKIDVFKTYPLSEYKTAATELEGRKTTGKLVLEIPQ